jgi:N6-adenosine-specific RNA methylase IME4
VRLRAQRLYGELLGPAELGKPASVAGSNTSTADRSAKHKAREVAKVPAETFQTFLEQDDPDRLSSAAVIREGRKETRPKRAPVKPPAGAYSVLYADPPWRYDDVKTASRAVENQYPTMSLPDIEAMEVPAADDAVLFLWATSPKLAEAMSVLDAWHFSYRTCAVWVKDRIGMGYYFRQRHELLLVAKRGKMAAPAEAGRPDSVIEAPRAKHSAKPALVYELIERMYPGEERLELFARAPRPGWTSWGNEAIAA